MKSWSVISSLPLLDRERTAHCRKNLHDNKTLNKSFCFPLCKRLRANVRNYPTSVRKRTLTKPADACKLNEGANRSPQTANPSQTKVCFPLIKGQKLLNYIYPHKAYSKHMFVFVILFYHNFLIKSIGKCPRSCTSAYHFMNFNIKY